MDDHAIIELYWQRDERAIHETDEKYGPLCFSLAWRILEQHEDAEECVSDTWLRAWNAMPPQRPGRLQHFLAKITRNLAFDRWRRDHADKRSAVTVALEELEECLPSPRGIEEPLREKELRKALDRFLRGLPQRERGIFLRRYFYVDSTKEIAEFYGLREDHVLTVLSRTRKKLRQHLRKGGFDA